MECLCRTCYIKVLALAYKPTQFEAKVSEGWSPSYETAHSLWQAGAEFFHATWEAKSMDTKGKIFSCKILVAELILKRSEIGSWLALFLYHWPSYFCIITSCFPLLNCMAFVPCFIFRMTGFMMVFNLKGWCSYCSLTHVPGRSRDRAICIHSDFTFWIWAFINQVFDLCISKTCFRIYRFIIEKFVVLSLQILPITKTEWETQRSVRDSSNIIAAHKFVWNTAQIIRTLMHFALRIRQH